MKGLIGIGIFISVLICLYTVDQSMRTHHGFLSQINEHEVISDEIIDNSTYATEICGDISK